MATFIRNSFSNRILNNKWRAHIVGLTFLAALVIFAARVEAAQVFCPSQFSGATYDVRFTLNSTFNYFRRTQSDVYCKVNVDPRRGIATTIKSQILKREPHGDRDYILFNAGAGGTWYEWLHIKIVDPNCGYERDLFGRNQVKFCTVVHRRSGNRWFDPHNSSGHWVRNDANRPPRSPTVLSPMNDSMAGTAPTLRWRNNGDPDGNRVHFHVRVWVWQSGGWKQVVSTNVNGISYLLRNLPRGTYVYWRVWAGDGKSWSNPVNARFRT